MQEIAKALAAAQMEMGKAIKGSTNPHFRSSYADLGNVVDACLPALNKNGIAVAQPQRHIDGEDYVVTMFIHTSGEVLESAVRLRVDKDNMQGLGSAITYARRYGLMGLAGIAPEDDDGNAAAQAPPKKQAPAQKAEPPAKEEMPPIADFNATEGDYPLPKKLQKDGMKVVKDIPGDKLESTGEWAKKNGYGDLAAACKLYTLPF